MQCSLLVFGVLMKVCWLIKGNAYLHLSCHAGDVSKHVAVTVGVSYTEYYLNSAHAGTPPFFTSLLLMVLGIML